MNNLTVIERWSYVPKIGDTVSWQYTSFGDVRLSLDDLSAWVIVGLAIVPGDNRRRFIVSLEEIGR